MNTWQTKLRNVVSAMGAGTALALAAPASADIIFMDGNNPQPDEENVLFHGEGSVDHGFTVIGVTNQTGIRVQFTSDELLNTPANGQARIEADDGAFDNISFGVVGGTFHDFILNLDVLNTPGGGRPITGTALITATDIFGNTFEQSMSITEGGQNFMTILAINGQRIESISVVSNAPLSFVDLAQPRISGAFECPIGSTDPRCVGGDQPVPEPGALSLLGAALASLATLRRRRAP